LRKKVQRICLPRSEMVHTSEQAVLVVYLHV
jgi:hypothetical protein